jgi:3-deoxy-manno-octulosonate cytidylyltransferase (CMP-KDO synthetase)
MDIPDAEVIVATDSGAIAREVAGIAAVTMTSSLPTNGTERVAEAALRPEHLDVDMIVNVQPDQLFLPKEAVLGAMRLTKYHAIGTAVMPLRAAVSKNANRVKVYVELGNRKCWGFFRKTRDDGGWDATYRAIPQPVRLRGLRAYEHLGIYAYTPAVLREWVTAHSTVEEKQLGLEQLRPLSMGLWIAAKVVLDVESPVVIDTEKDLMAAQAHFPIPRPLCP